jgi:hypothetical protein
MGERWKRWVNRRILQRVVRKKPLLVVGDFVLVAGFGLIAVVFSWVGISGVTDSRGSARVFIFSLFFLSVALAAAYVVVAAAGLWLLEWLWPERWGESDR